MFPMCWLMHSDTSHVLAAAPLCILIRFSVAQLLVWIIVHLSCLLAQVTVMFFFRNKHIMIDLGTGNNNKINW